MSDFQSVLAFIDLAENSSVAVEFHGMSVLVCRSGDEIFAVENLCSHQAQLLEGGRIRNGCIFCPVHGMRFRLSTGEPLGQLTRISLKTIESRIIDGQIQLGEPAQPG